MLVSTVLLFVALGVSTSTASQLGPPIKKPKYAKVKICQEEDIKNNTDCEISVKDNVDKQMPLVLSENCRNILYPSIPVGTDRSEAKKIVTITHGKKISIACPGLHFTVPNVKKYQPMAIVCNNGTFKTTPLNAFKFSELKCSGVPKSYVKKYINTREIGFQIDGATAPFIPLIKIYETRAGFYTYHKLLNSAAYASTIVRKSHFMEGTCTINFKSADNYYHRPSQQTAINDILKPLDGNNTYISNESGTNKYLARGHLAPVGDFLYPAERDATNVCDNIAPQWQAINNGNWRTVESYVREIALNKGSLSVYTGTHQVASIKNRRLYLASNNQLPVPRYYWKMVQDIKTSKTIVFITLNNPYEGDMATERTLGLFRFCKGSCHRLKGLNSRSFDSLGKGLTECCEVNRRLRNELGAPAIISGGLLTK